MVELFYAKGIEEYFRLKLLLYDPNFFSGHNRTLIKAPIM